MKLLKFDYHSLFYLLFFALSFYTWSVFFQKIILFYAYEDDISFIKMRIEYESLEHILQSLPSEYNKKKPASMLLWLLVQSYDDFNYTFKTQEREDNFYEKITEKTDTNYFLAQDNFLTKKALCFIQESIQNLNKSLNTIDSIASISPFVGLLGTIIGFILTLKNMNSDLSIIQLSSAISQSLISTAISLIISIPASFFYNFFQSKSDQSRENLILLSQQIIDKMHEQNKKKDNKKYKTPINLFHQI